MIDQAELNAKEEANWRAEFEKLGREHVRARRYSGREREVARQWLRDKELEAEARERADHHYLKWTFWAVLLALVVAILALVVAIWALPSDRIKAIMDLVGAK
jgi:predicted anti-sigma-YlaC factor YlaD